MSNSPYHQKRSETLKEKGHRDARYTNNEAMKMLIFEFLIARGRNRCIRCGQLIGSCQEFVLDHVIPWRQATTDDEKVRLYRDPHNIEPAHDYCNRVLGSSDTKRERLIGVVRDSRGIILSKTMIEGKSIFLGQYRFEKEAAVARDMATVYFRGTSGVLNFPDLFNAYTNAVSELPAKHIVGSSDSFRAKVSEVYKHYDL